MGRRKSTALTIAVPAATYAELEARASDCLARVHSARAHTTDDLRLLGGVVDLLLWCLWDTDPATAGYWSDGVLFETVELCDARTLVVSGSLWCGDHRQQWVVPAQVVLELREPPEPLRRVLTRFGDASRASLRDTGTRPRSHQPKEWLCEFDVERPHEEVLDVTPVVAEFRGWLAAHPCGRIVGEDWQPLSPTDADALIHGEVRAGRLPVLQETWLDGGAALRLA